MQLSAHNASLACALAVCGACVEPTATGHELACEPTRVEVTRTTPLDAIDLLFVVDNSCSMSEEQSSFGMQFPRLVHVLGSGDLDPEDGVVVGQDFPVPESLHVGFVSSDMGTGGFRVPTCNEPSFGDDGVLVRAGNGLAGCLATYPAPFLSYTPSAPDADYATMVHDMSCIGVLGTGGCGFEQQLEAALKAVTPSTAEPFGAFDGRFVLDSRGHADDANAGFLRPDALLVIVIATDEEDCSAADPDLYNPGSATYTGDLNLRPFDYSHALHPIARYVDGLLAGRAPDQLVFAVIAGVPPETEAAPGLPTDFDAMLDHPLMQVMIDPAMPTRIRPSCDVPGRGIAFQPRRMVEVAAALEQRGASSMVHSICQADFTPAFDGITRAIADALVHTPDATTAGPAPCQ